MAEKLSIRERARIALGDFDFPLDMLHQKMSEIFKEEARARGLDDDTISLAAAIIARDGNLSALGKKRIEDIFPDQEEAQGKKNDAIEAAAHNSGALYASMKAGGKEQAEKKPPAKIKTRGQYWAEVKRRQDAAKAEKAAREAKTPKEEKRGRGRPRKHESGSQISIWFHDDMKAAINQRALVWHCSFSDAVNELLRLAIKGKY